MCKRMAKRALSATFKIIAACIFIHCAVLTMTPADAATETRVPGTFVTGYAAYDNDPPGRTISCPRRHPRATVDIGTYDRPVTLAADTPWYPCGTRVYLPKLRKYGIVEDSCEACQHSHRPWLDIYVSDSRKKTILTCERQMTYVASGPIRNPRRGYPVSTRRICP